VTKLVLAAIIAVAGLATAFYKAFMGKSAELRGLRKKARAIKYEMDSLRVGSGDYALREYEWMQVNKAIADLSVKR